MPLFGKLEIFEPSSSPITSLFDFPLAHEAPELSYPLHLFGPSPNFFDPVSFASPFGVFDSVVDVTRIERTPFSSSYQRVRSTSGLDSSALLRSFSLCDPFTSLDLDFPFDPVRETDRTYTWTAEFKCPEKKWLDKTYKLTAEIKGSEKHGDDRKYKWTAEIKGGKPDKCTDAIKEKHKSVGIKIKEPVSAAGVCIEGPGKVEKKQKGVRVVEIEEPVGQGAIFLRQAFGKRAGAVARARGKTKELSPQDAALMIQMSFRAYLIRRSQALRSLRELAVSKSKLKEIRVLFNNFSYRQRIARDAEECKCFTERIIALLLAVDAIQGADLMVRAGRRSMLDELEAMLDAVDPQPSGKLGFIRGRKFVSLQGNVHNEIAAGVAEVVQMLDEAEKSENTTFEV